MWPQKAGERKTQRHARVLTQTCVCVLSKQPAGRLPCCLGRKALKADNISHRKNVIEHGHSLPALTSPEFPACVRNTSWAPALLSLGRKALKADIQARGRSRRRRWVAVAPKTSLEQQTRTLLWYASHSTLTALSSIAPTTDILCARDWKLLCKGSMQRRSAAVSCLRRAGSGGKGFFWAHGGLTVYARCA